MSLISLVCALGSVRRTTTDSNSQAALLAIASIQIYSVSQGSGMHYWNTDLDKVELTRQVSATN